VLLGTPRPARTTPGEVVGTEETLVGDRA
jgi:hypothetical protein